MKQLLIFALLSLFVFINCTQDDEMANLDMGMEDIELDLRGGDKVDVCHNGHIINVNVNSLEAHQEHGDAVDMDGDGYFDIDNLCGPTDCDDTNPELTDNCCNEELEFCENSDMWNFDPTCDTYCDYNFIYSYVVDGCEYYSYSHYTYLYTEEFSFGDCDANGIVQNGIILLAWGIDAFCEEERIWGEISYFLQDSESGFIFDSYTYAETQEAQDLAIGAATIIQGLATELGMEDECEDEIYEFLASNEGENEVNGTDVGFEKLDEKNPLRHRTLSDDLWNKITRQKKGEGLR